MCKTSKRYNISNKKSKTNSCITIYTRIVTKSGDIYKICSHILNYKDKKLDDIDIFRLKYINMIKSDEYSKMYDVSFLETQINTIVRIIKLNYLDNYAIIQSENSRFLETFMINCVSDEHFNNIFKRCKSCLILEYYN